MQQVGTPTDIYERPANTFVAAFIGNPAMNLVEGRLEGGTFRAEGIAVAGLPGRDGPVTLGFRAEDAEIAPEGGELRAPVYATELLGDAVLISWRLGGALVSVRAPKDSRAEIGDALGARIPAAACHLFDAGTGRRLQPGA